MSRLSTIDAVWLAAEGDGPPWAVGALVELDGPAPSIQGLRDLLRDRTAGADRMRERLVADPLQIRQASWQEAEPDFEHHVREVPLGPAADQSTLERAVGDLMQTGMDLERPLWDFTMFTGMAEGRWAIVSRLHHAVADGQGALLLIGRLIDVDAAGSRTLTEVLDELMSGARATTDTSSRQQDTAELLAEAAKRGGDLVLRALRTVTSASASARALESAADAVTKQAGTLGTQLPKSAGLLAGDPGQQRVWHSTHVPLADVKRIRRALGGTVNDIVMTLMSGGYRALLSGWGMDPEGYSVRVLVPVSLRSPGDLAANNQVSALLVMLPLSGDTESRFADIRAHLNDVKNLGTAPLAAPVYEAIDRTVPAFVQTFAIDAFLGSVGASFIETLVTNVPGPQFPVFVAGRQAHTMAPIIPVGEPLRLTAGILSYNGELHFGLTGGEGIGEGVHLIEQGIHETMQELLAATAKVE